MMDLFVQYNIIRFIDLLHLLPFIYVCKDWFTLISNEFKKTHSLFSTWIQTSKRLQKFQKIKINDSDSLINQFSVAPFGIIVTLTRSDDCHFRIFITDCFKKTYFVHKERIDNAKFSDCYIFYAPFQSSVDVCIDFVNININLISFDSIVLRDENSYSQKFPTRFPWEQNFMDDHQSVIFYGPFFDIKNCTNNLFQIIKISDNHEYISLTKGFNRIRIFHFPQQPNHWIFAEKSITSYHYVYFCFHQPDKIFKIIKNWESGLFLDFAYDEEFKSIGGLWFDLRNNTWLKKMNLLISDK